MKTLFKVLESHQTVDTWDDGVTLSDAVDLVVAMDVQDGRVGYTVEQAQIIQVPCARVGFPPFVVHIVPGRGDRPQRPKTCPLDLPALTASGQHFLTVQIPGWNARVLANPYAYLPGCVTWATDEHVPQKCSDCATHRTWHQIIETMLLLCRELGDHVVGFNETAGNSLDHSHLVSHLPIDGLGLYPVQQVAARVEPDRRTSVSVIGPASGYPVDVWRVGLVDVPTTAKIAAALIAQWQQIGGRFATANCAAFMENGQPTLYVIPRNSLLKPLGWAAMPAFLEMLGVFIASHPKDILRVRSGKLRFPDFATVLASLRCADAERLNLNEDAISV